MIDLTGANLVAYLLRIIRDVANRNPRFRSALGDVTFATSTARSPASQIQFGNVQVIVKEVSSDGHRLSPDYFMTTQHGRAILAQVEDKPGLFIEFVREVASQNPGADPGVYYMNVDSVSEETREVCLTIQKYKWREGFINNATGSLVYFRTGLNADIMVPSDSTQPGLVIQYQSFGTNQQIFTPIVQLVYTNSQNNQVLTPNIDYWVVRTTSQVVCQSTAGGLEVISIPDNALSIQIVNQNNYTLRPNIDYVFYGGNKFIEVSQWTPKGSTLTAVGTFKIDPSTPNAVIAPENYLNVTLEEGESLAPGEVFVRTADGDTYNLTVQADGALLLPSLLAPGTSAQWEARIVTNPPQYKAKALKMDMNKDLIPGLWIAIGDLVTVNDQLAIIVSPTFTETYEVYGSKENVRFVLDIKSNDLTSASELTEAIKAELLIRGRTNMESDGVTIFDAPRSYRAEGRDGSGTAPSYTFTLGVTAACDWKVFIPLVTRLTSYEVNGEPYIIGYVGQINPQPYPAQLHFTERSQSFGTSQFVFQFIPWTA